MDHMNYAAMQAGVNGSQAVLAVITGPCVDSNSDAEPVDNAYVSRSMCCNELRWARECDVPIIPLVCAEDKKNIWDFMQLAPEDLRYLTNLDFIHIDRSSRSDMEHGGRKVIERFTKVAPTGSDIGPRGGAAVLDEFVRVHIAFKGDVTSWNSEQEEQLKRKIALRCNMNMPIERIKLMRTHKRKRVRCMEEGSSVEVSVEISDKGFIQVNSDLQSSSDDEREEEEEEITVQVKSRINNFFKGLPELASVHVKAEFVDEFEYRYRP